MAQTKYKLARCSKYGPPERNLEEVKELERRFVLDCVAVSTFSDDSGRANPKMSTAIPPYNAQKDKHAKEYFQKPVTKNLLKKTEQVSTFLKTMSRLSFRWYFTQDGRRNLQYVYLQ